MSFRILVIDSNRSALVYYQHVLQAEGYGIEIGTFATESWQEIERASPDLIIFDLLVDIEQERQAWHLTQQLHASVLTASIPLLVCIAAFLLPSFALFLQETHIPILFKPFGQTELRRKLLSLLLPTPEQSS